MAKTKKHPRHKIIVGEFIFWLHTVILILLLVAGLFIDWWWIVLILLAVRAQQIVFHGCILTLLQAREGGIRKGMAYFQLAAKRFVGIRLTRTGVHIVSYGHTTATLAVVLFANINHIRLNL